MYILVVSSFQALLLERENTCSSRGSLPLNKTMNQHRTLANHRLNRLSVAPHSCPQHAEERTNDDDGFARRRVRLNLFALCSTLCSLHTHTPSVCKLRLSQLYSVRVTCVTVL